MKFENTKVWGFENALKGMRNPKESWDKNDSKYCIVNKNNELKDVFLGNISLDTFTDDCEIKYIIGPNDMQLAQTLILAGSEHRKFMRQIFVSVDITAPLYWY